MRALAALVALLVALLVGCGVESEPGSPDAGLALCPDQPLLCTHDGRCTFDGQPCQAPRPSPWDCTVQNGDKITNQPVCALSWGAAQTKACDGSGCVVLKCTESSGDYCPK